MRYIILYVVLALSVFAFADDSGTGIKTNLVPNGTFDENPKSLNGWDQFPEDGSVKWVTLDAERGKGILFSLSKKVAHSTGLLFYSEYIPIEEGKKYRFSLDYRSDGPKPKPFIKGYALFPDVHDKVERREIYKKQIFVDNVSSEWTTITMEFTPKNPIYEGKYEIKWVKVLLYAYLKPGKIYFDNVRIEESE